MSSTTRRVLAIIVAALLCYLVSFSLGRGAAALIFLVIGGCLELSLWAEAWNRFRSSD